MSDPWLKPLDAEIRGGLKQLMRQQTDGQRTILTPRTDFQSLRKPSNFIPPNGETITVTETITNTETITATVTVTEVVIATVTVILNETVTEVVTVTVTVTPEP